MSDQRGSKRPSDQDRIARLQQKFAKIDNGRKSRVGTSAQAPSSRPYSEPLETRPNRLREEQLAAIAPISWSRRDDPRPRDPSASTSRAKPIKQKSSAQKAFVTKFDDHLTSEVAESSRCSDPVMASSDLVNKLVEVSCSDHAPFIIVIIIF